MAMGRAILVPLGLAAALLVLVGAARAQDAEVQVVTDGGAIVVEGVEGSTTVAPPVMSGPYSSQPGQPVAVPGVVPPGGPQMPGKPEDKGEKPDKEKGKSEVGKEGPEKKEGKPEEGKEGEEGTKPIMRPTQPPKPPDPEELKIRPDKEGKIRLNFNGQPWQGVLELLADLSGMSLDWQELPGDYLNLTTQHSYTIEEARDLINCHLLARGYTLLRQGEILSVVNTKKLNPGMVPRVTPEELESRSPHEFVRVSFPLDWMMAETAVEEFQPMLSPNGKLTALTATNRLEAMDAVVNLREIYHLLKAEQSDEGQERLVREFRLQYARATEVREQLMTLLGMESKGGMPKGGMTPEQMQQMQQMQQAEQQAKMMAEMQKQQGKPGGPAVKKPRGDVTLVADSRNNKIIAHAPADRMAEIEQAIKLLDVPTERGQSLLAYQNRMQVYRLETIDPQALVTTLRDLGDLDPSTRLEVDNKNNAIVAFATLADHVTIRTLVDKLDSGGRKAVVIQLEDLDARSVAKTIDFMMGGGREAEGEQEDTRRRGPYDFFDIYPRFGPRERRGSREHADQFRVDADVKNNTLLLWANEFEVAKVQHLLENLRQVSSKGGDPRTLKVYRLVAIDPEPLVKTLEDLGTLDFRTTLEVDKKNSAVIARATSKDHQIIQALIEELDGSGRQFHVIALQRLEADYVAGTIEFMMAGKEETSQSASGRTYVFNEYYGSSSGREKEKKPDEFRVDADLVFNRLLLWANDIELEEVTNLLVKLGEIPPEGGNPSTIRVLDVLPGPEQQRLLEHIRRVWPSLAPNPLLLPPAEEPAEDKPATDDTKPAEKTTPAVAEPKTAARGNDSAARQWLSQWQTGGIEAPDAGDTAVVDAGLLPPVFALAAYQAGETEPGKTAPAVQEAPPGGDSGGTAARPAAPGEQAPSSAAPADTAKSAGAGESSGTAGSKAKNPAPVSITQTPDGRLIITSEDTRALDRLEELMMRLAPPRKEYQVFHLKYAEAYWVKWNLEDFFKEDQKKKSDSSDAYWAGWYGVPWSSGQSSDTSRRLSRRRPLTLISDDTTNTILVQGADPGQLKTIGDLIELYDQPQLTDRDSARKTEVFQIQYSKAAVIAEAIKDVYRDLLSTRDKALDRNQQGRQRFESRFSYVYGDADESGEKKPRFKGLLSIGVDSHSNCLIVSAPAYLFDGVAQMIERLDEAAKPVDTVRVVKVGQGLGGEQLRETLQRVLGEASAGQGRPVGQPGQPVHGHEPVRFGPPPGGPGG